MVYNKWNITSQCGWHRFDPGTHLPGWRFVVEVGAKSSSCYIYNEGNSLK